MFGEEKGDAWRGKSMKFHGVMWRGESGEEKEDAWRGESMKFHEVTWRGESGEEKKVRGEVSL